MAESEARYPGGASWSIDDVPYYALDREQVKDNALLLYIVATAAFVEITSDVYTRNLAEFFGGDEDVVDWLQNAWESEELQHGRALKRYVETAWPDFGWDGAYGSFLAEFLRFCSVDQLAQTRALEMAARCVVETGTAAFYRALAEMSPEPVLRTIAAAISADEVRHYKHFYRFFLRYREREQPSRTAVARTLWARIGEVDAEDAFYAFKHVYLARNPSAEFREDDYAAFRAQLRPLVVRHFPHRMASKMLLKPLGLSAPVGRLVVPAVASASRLLFLM
ncbi:MAG: ferritin-like domain-containing protein [Stellaceae bacterium]